MCQTDVPLKNVLSEFDHYRLHSYAFMKKTNQNSLQVIHQIDNLSPGAVTGGKLVPSSHKSIRVIKPDLNIIYPMFSLSEVVSASCILILVGEIEGGGIR